MIGEKPLVSICSITYNHALYIRDCLDGLLMQKTDFPFEIIINDDCSTDGTTEIIKEYVNKYPNIISPIYHDENQYQKGIRGMYQRFVYPKARGKYIALCEGDDYWTDPLKLQKQVDFMESHPDFSMCFHRVSVMVEDKLRLSNDIFNHLQEREYNETDLLMRLTVPTCSALFRKGIIVRCPVNPKFQYGDNILWLTAIRSGRTYCLGEEMGVYRRHSGSWTTMDSYSTSTKQVTHFLAVMESFNLRDNPIVNEKLRFFMAKSFLTGILSKKPTGLEYLITGIKKYNYKFILSIIEVIRTYFMSHKNSYQNKSTNK